MVLWVLLPVLVGISPFAILDYIIPNNSHGEQRSSNLASVYVAARAEEAPILELLDEPKYFTIGWAGDIAPDTEASFETFERVLYYTREPDVLLGNFEGVVTDGTLTKRRCIPDDKTCWIFRGDTGFIEVLKRVGFDAVNLANNHMRDYEIPGEEQTRSFLLDASVPAVGNGELVLVKKQDVIIGLIGAYLHGRHDYSDIVPLVQKSNQTADITVVMMHGGEEGRHARHTYDKDEYHKGYFRGNLYGFAHDMVDNGADLVLGSGPHVLRGIEKYRNSLIVYSMGNFYGTEFSTDGVLAASGIFTTTFDENFDIVDAQLVPLTISEAGIPSIDHSRASIDFVNNLSQEDFDNNAVLFDENGFSI